MARLTPGHIAELKVLHAQCRTAFAFLFDRRIIAVGRAEAESGLDAALTLQNLRGMRIALRDLQVLVQDLPAADLAALDEMVVSATGRSLFADSAKTTAALAEIVRRGRILNERECQLVRARYDELEDRVGYEQETKQLRDLLDSFGA